MKWSMHWIKHSELISIMSPCPRGQVGAFIIDQYNNPISSGFNGGPRGSSGRLCGLDKCKRNSANAKSGTLIEIGCHHAEMNAICNASKKGISLKDCSIVISTRPCLLCAKIIHHSGISKVIIPKNSNYSLDGIEYLKENNIDLVEVDS